MNTPLMHGNNMNPLQSFMQWYGQARNNISDPNAYLQQLMQSGQVSQNQINAAQPKAQMFMQMFGQFLK